jgi:hypothetical protein
MHNKYARDGFVALSVSIDDPSNKEEFQSVLKFLKDKKADFTNVILDEDPAVWQEKLKISGTPCIYVFDRDNRIDMKLAGDDKRYPEVDFGAIEKRVQELLKK